MGTKNADRRAQEKAYGPPFDTFGVVPRGWWMSFWTILWLEIKPRLVTIHQMTIIWMASFPITGEMTKIQADSVDPKIMATASGLGMHPFGWLPPIRNANTWRSVTLTKPKLRQAIQNCRHGLLLSGVCFFHDNTWPHTAARTTVVLDQFGWEKLEPYSSDLASTDFHLFLKAEGIFRGDGEWMTTMN